MNATSPAKIDLTECATSLVANCTRRLEITLEYRERQIERNEWAETVLKSVIDDLKDAVKWSLRDGGENGHH